MEPNFEEKGDLDPARRVHTPISIFFQDFVKGCIEDDLADHNLYARVSRFKMIVDNYL